MVIDKSGRIFDERRKTQSRKDTIDVSPDRRKTIRRDEAKKNN